MAGISLIQAQTHLDAWLAADLAVTNSQSYSIGGRSLSHVDAEEITSKIKYWQNQLANLTNGGIKQRRVIPRDI